MSEVPRPNCDLCGAPDAEPAVREQYVQYEEGMAGFDAPVLYGNLCTTCMEEEDCEPLTDWQ